MRPKSYLRYLAITFLSGLVILIASIGCINFLNSADSEAIAPPPLSFVALISEPAFAATFGSLVALIAVILKLNGERQNQNDPSD